MSWLLRGPHSRTAIAPPEGAPSGRTRHLRYTAILVLPFWMLALDDLRPALPNPAHRRGAFISTRIFACGSTKPKRTSQSAVTMFLSPPTRNRQRGDLIYPHSHGLTIRQGGPSSITVPGVSLLTIFESNDLAVLFSLRQELYLFHEHRKPEKKNEPDDDMKKR